jgi:hypothetical protein
LGKYNLALALQNEFSPARPHDAISRRRRFAAKKLAALY